MNPEDIQKRPANFYLGTSLPRQKLGGPRFKPRSLYIYIYV